MVEFSFNNAKNTSISHLPFEPNYSYGPSIIFEKELDPYSKSLAADALVVELKNIITIYQQNLLYIQKVQKYYNNKLVKFKN